MVVVVGVVVLCWPLTCRCRSQKGHRTFHFEQYFPPSIAHGHNNLMVPIPIEQVVTINMKRTYERDSNLPPLFMKHVDYVKW